MKKIKVVGILRGKQVKILRGKRKGKYAIVIWSGLTIGVRFVDGFFNAYKPSSVKVL